MKKIYLYIVIFNLLTYSTVRAQWIQKNSGSNDILIALHFPTKDIGYVVGVSGTILKSIDAGETWITKYSNPNIEFKSVYFINEFIGFVVGSTVLKTIDGGDSWNKINPTISDINKIEFKTSQIGFMAGSSGIYKTLDGGNNWSLKSTIPCRSMSFPSQNIGYVHGNANSLFKTSDGGETWVLLNSNANPGNFSIINDMFFTSEDKGFFGGYYYGVFTKTIDGGSNWNCVLPDCSADIGVGVTSIHFPSINVGYAVCHNIQKTIDGGDTWSVQNGIEGLSDVYFTNENVGYAVGSGGSIFKTENGGILGLQSSTFNNIKIYPNPTVNNLNIEVQTNFIFPLNFQLDNILGKNLINTDLNSSSNTIDLSKYSKGIYIYKLLNSDKEIVKIGKIIKN